MKSISRRKVLGGGMAIVGVTTAIVPFATAKNNEVQILKKAIEEIRAKNGAGEEFYKKVKFVRGYPVKTVEGLAEKLKYVWGYDHCSCIEVIERDIYRLAGQEVPLINFNNDIYHSG